MNLNFVRFIFIYHLLFYNLVFGQSSCLEDIHTGEFIYSSSRDTSIIRRSEGYQEEIFNAGYSRIGSKVTWLNKNEYLLEVTDIENVEFGPDFDIEVGTVIRIVVKTCKKDYYEFVASLDNTTIGPTRYYRKKE